jgi:paraquat-inducible protein A
MSGQVSGAMLVACHDCGEVHRVPELGDGRTAVCARCGGVLLRHRVASIERALALNLAALLLFGVANLFPVMTMRLGGRAEAATLLEGVTALYRDGMWGLAGVVLLAAILIPLLKLIGSIWVLTQAYAGRRPRLLAPVFRLVGLLHPWAMTEVYLLGLVVAWVKLRDLATIELGTALFALVGLILLMIWADVALEPHEVWERVAPQTRAAPGEDPAKGSFLACHGCRQLVPAAGLADQHHASCPRCGTPLHRRKPESLARTSALLLTAAILYVPANLLPVMTVVSLGEGEPDTILSGVKALAAVGMWPIALLVFFASITVPCLKMIGLSYLLVSVGRRSTRRQRDRTVMYRLIETVGRWSMVDVFMISILAALVNLDQLATIRPGPGAVAFAAVVILTMLASLAFDPRLIWDAAENWHDNDRSTRS